MVGYNYYAYTLTFDDVIALILKQVTLTRARDDNTIDRDVYTRRSTRINVHIIISF